MHDSLSYVCKMLITPASWTMLFWATKNRVSTLCESGVVVCIEHTYIYMDYFPISSIFSIIKSSSHHHIRNSLDISSSYLQYNLKYKYTMIITHGIFLGFWFLVRNEEKNEIPCEKRGKFEETPNITFSPISLILGVFWDNFWPFFGN